MPKTQNLTDDLLKGRRALDGRPAVKLLDDWHWQAPLEMWSLQLQIEITELTVIPARTNWFVLVDPSYPFGEIEVFPSNTGYGITTTFPHQEYNDAVSGLPFRSGKICLSDPISSLGRGATLSEPFDANERLLWHVDRLTEWIKAADSGNLQREGDHFELPHFPSTGPISLGFNETKESFQQWQNTTATQGSASVVLLNGRSVVVTEFREYASNLRYAPAWGTVIASADVSRAIWLRLPDIPLVENWRVPTTWGELDRVCKQQGVQLFPVLQSLNRGIRDGKQHLLLLGFPIPSAFNEPATQLHWQALSLPVLSNGKLTAPGFRHNELGYWRRDEEKFFAPEHKIQWLPSCNWSNAAIQARGNLIDEVAAKSVAIIGCGSLGSSIAELLVRLGVHKMILIDGDKITAPNLSRHNLLLPDVGINKAVALAQRLNEANPLAKIKSLPANLSEAKQLPTELAEADLIIDCSASDAVLRVLSVHGFDNPKTFFSFSIARGATKLYAFCAGAESFPLKDFHTATQPTLKAEAELLANADLHWESAGCWHPLFPARLDDISILAAFGVKWIEKQISNQTSLFEILALPSILPLQEELVLK